MPILLEKEVCRGTNLGKVAEGKQKMSVLNAVKAKLIHRVMSVVQRKQK